jgi:predicted dithiol-disulfide oxidoreductase (DUF899 family)
MESFMHETTGWKRCGRFEKGDGVMTRFVFSGESEEYRRCREELLTAEIVLKDQVERVAALRRALPLGMSVPDYVFREGPMDLTRNDAADFRDVRLTDLFTDGHNTLIIDHLMFTAEDDEPCVMCSMWADGYNAVTPHVRQRASFVLIAKAEINKLRRWARQRGWDRIRLLSSHDNTFNRDFGMEGADGAQYPGLSVFARTPDGAIYHRYTIGADFDDHNNRGIDLYSPVWNLFDLLPQGRGDWYPSHSYMERHVS